MKSECQIFAVCGVETTELKISGSGRDLCGLLVAIMVSFLKKGLVDPHGLFCLVSAATLVASEE